VDPIDTLFTNAKFADGSINDIAVANGRIAAVSPAGTRIPAGGPTHNLDSALVVPGFVEGHIHLDTSFYGDAW
jgi:cytosine deaminase